MEAFAELIAPEQEAATPYETLRLRDYQKFYCEQFSAALKTAAAPDDRWNVEAPRDRGYLISPWQTGKSFLAGSFATMAHEVWPGKKTLFVSPFKVITQQTISDLAKTFNGRVSVIDNKNKDSSGDVVVASAMTLKNVLHDIRSDEFGLFIIDEATFVLTSTWQKIMNHFGFINAKGKLIRARDKFAIGIAASGERGDGRHIRDFFGDRLIAARGFQWFIENGYLHDIIGMEIPYGSSDKDWESIGHADETVVAMRNTPENRARLIDEYKRHLGGRRALVFVESVAHAQNLADDFNRILGDRYAVAITSETDDQVVLKELKAYNSGSGSKVLVSVRRLAIGFRALNTDGVMHGYQTSSWSLYAQRTSRALARQSDEPQRHVLVITMEGRTMTLDGGQTAATFLGVYEKMPKGTTYKPREIHKSRRTHSTGTRGGYRRYGRGKLHVGEDRIRTLNVRAQAFGQAMQDVLTSKFGGDVMLMAETCRLGYAECDAYLHGYLPASFRKVVDLETRMRVRHGTLAEPWLHDQMALLEANDPLPRDEKDPENDRRIYAPKRKLARLVRRAVLRMSTNSELTSVVQDKTEYLSLPRAFKADIPIRAEAVEKLFDFVVNSGAVMESEAREVFGRYVHAVKRWEKRRTGKPSLYFDHTHIDALGRSHRLDDVSNYIEPLSLPEQLTYSAHQEEEIIQDQLKETVRRTLGTLVPRQEKILRMRFGIGCYPEQSFLSSYYADGVTRAEIGMEFERSAAKIHQIEEKAIELLRHPSRSRRLLPFLPPHLQFTDKTRVEILQAHAALHKLKKHVDPTDMGRLERTVANLKRLTAEVTYARFEPVGVRLSLLDLIRERQGSTDTKVEELVAAGKVYKYIDLPFVGDPALLWELLNGLLDLAVKEAHDGHVSPHGIQSILERFNEVISSGRHEFVEDKVSLEVSFNSVLGYREDSTPMEQQAQYWYHLAIKKRHPRGREHGELSGLELLAIALKLDPDHKLAEQLFVTEILRQRKELSHITEELHTLFPDGMPTGLIERIQEAYAEKTQGN